MNKLVFLITVILIILPVEIYFSKQAYFTVSALGNALFYVLSYTSVFLSILFFAVNKNKISMAILITGMLLVIPLNLYFTDDLYKLKVKSDKIVHWAYQQKMRTDSFPQKLEMEHDPRIKYTKSEGDGFTLFFYVTTPATGHFYSSKDGWGYMDD